MFYLLSADHLLCLDHRYGKSSSFIYHCLLLALAQKTPVFIFTNKWQETSMQARVLPTSPQLAVIAMGNALVILAFD